MDNELLYSGLAMMCSATLGFMHGYNRAKSDAYLETVPEKKAKVQSLCVQASIIYGALPQMVAHDSLVSFGVGAISGATLCYLMSFVGNRVWHKRNDDKPVLTLEDIALINDCKRRVKETAIRGNDAYLDSITEIFRPLFSKLALKTGNHPEMQKAIDDALADIKNYKLCFDHIKQAIECKAATTFVPETCKEAVGVIYNIDEEIEIVEMQIEEAEGCILPVVVTRRMECWRGIDELAEKSYKQDRILVFSACPPDRKEFYEEQAFVKGVQLFNKNLR